MKVPILLHRNRIDQFVMLFFVHNFEKHKEKVIVIDLISFEIFSSLNSIRIFSQNKLPQAANFHRESSYDSEDYSYTDNFDRNYDTRYDDYHVDYEYETPKKATPDYEYKVKVKAHIRVSENNFTTAASTTQYAPAQSLLGFFII